jgi:hypothetical protein
MNRRRVLYRLIDVVNHEANRVAYSVPQSARSAFCALRRLRSSRSAARRIYPERAAAQISFTPHEKELPRASHGRREFEVCHSNGPPVTSW